MTMEVTVLEQPRIETSEAFLKNAQKRISTRQQIYRPYYAYYEGNQPLSFATRRYSNTFGNMVRKFNENICPAVVDAITDRLTITGFEVEGDDSEDAANTLWDAWRYGRMDNRAGEVHKEAVKTGDAYVIVAPDALNRPRFFPQSAHNMTVHYADESDMLDWAAKMWLRDDKYARMAIYFTDRVERYISSEPLRGDSIADNVNWVPLPPEEGPAIVLYDYNRVPVFHFANNASIGQMGDSDLKDVLVIQDALNKSVADLLVAMEFASWHQRWATGLDVEIGEDGKPKAPFEPGVDRIWVAPGDNVRFGEFAESDLGKFIQVHDMFLMSCARVSGIPVHHMLINPASFPSGESLKTAEARFTAKVSDRQINFGATWEDAITFAATLIPLELTGRVNVQWVDPSPRSDNDLATTSLLKKQFGVSDQQLMRENGYSERQIEQIQEEAATQAEASLERNMRFLAQTNGSEFDNNRMNDER